jgi:hypothetical protein
MITCPFKYSEKYTYCDCPYPKGEVDFFDGAFKSLQEAWKEHLIEISNHEANKENE